MPKTIHALLSKRWLLCFVVLLGFQGVNAQLSVILNETDPACFGLASGSIVTNTSGGQLPLTYAWSNGATTPFIENLNAGTYSVTVTDANGLTGSATALLEQPPQITLNLTSDQECQEPFTLSANGGGGVFPYTYNWSTGANTQTVEVPSGTYCVTIVDANLCGTFGCITVDLNPPSVSVTSVDVTCFGGEDGSLTAFPASGTPPYTYSWSNGATTQTISGLTVGTYGVTITDAGGCTASAFGTVAQPTQLNVAVTQDGPVCAGDFDITITAFPTGGTPGYTYLWSTGATTQAISGFGAGTYSVTITDQNNCTVVGAATVLEAPSPDVQISGDDVICGLGSDTELTAVPSGGTPGYQLLWSTGSVMPTITVTTPGVYSVTVTDANGCTDMAQATVTLVDLSVTTSTTNVSCFGFNDGTATVFGSGGTQPYTYMWTTGAVTQTVTGLAPGTYGFTITEADNCKASGTVTITQPAPIGITGNVTNPLCFGDATGSINVSVSGGTPPYSYAWNNGAITQDISNLSAGSYTITVTDANNCTATATFVVTQPADLTASTVVTNVDCFGDATGAIDLSVFGGTAPYTYDWSDDGNEDPDDDPEDRINLIAATYQVTVTDANGCTVVTQATVTQPPLLVLNTTSVNVDCFGQSTGSIDLTVVGGTPAYSYLWNTGSTNQDLNNLPAGTYTVTVTDQNECTQTTSITISQPNQISITGVVTNLDCFGDGDGAIDVSVVGGTQPFSYSWSNGAITQDLNNLAGGNYSLTVTDANACTASVSFTVTEPSQINLSTVVTDVACAGDATGAINLTVSGGSAPYTYDWSNDGNDDPDDDDQDLTNLSAGTYTVTVTDANGCTAITSATVNAPPAIVLNTSKVDVLCFGQSTGSIDLTVTGGTPAYSYLWNTGATSQDLNNLPAGTYTVTVTDQNECTQFVSIVIEQPSQLEISAITGNVSCFGGNDGSIDLSVSGGTPPYTYVWSNGSTTQDLNNLTAGTYTGTVTDANGCTISAPVTITEPTDIVLTTLVTDVVCDGGATGAIDLTVVGGTAPYTYDWSNDGNEDPDDDTQDLDNLFAGTYSVTVTDANGCTAITNATVDALNPIAVSGIVTDLNCFGDNSGAINLTVSGGTAPYSYAWNNGALTQDLNNLAAGTYTVIVTDINECTAEATFTVEQPDAIALNISAPTIVCGGTNSGSILANPSGGTAPYSFLWSNGAITSSINDLPAGIYGVTVTDANGCQATDNTIQLTEIPNLSCSVQINQQPTSGNNGSLTVNVTGGTAPFTYDWSNGATTPTINGLSAGTYSVTVTDANNCTTVCSATLQPFSGIGNFVWIDADLDGIQDPNEVGFPGVTVNLKNAAGVVIATTTTDADGMYLFDGLAPGTYSVQFVPPVDWDYTASNIGADDALDSDIIPGMAGMTGTYDLDPGEFDLTVDAGLIFLEGIITDPCNCLDNATTSNNGQFFEELTITTFSGLTWTIIDQTNMYINAPINDPPAPLVLVPIGTVLTETPIGGGLSQYVIDFRLVDATTYTVEVQAGEQILSLSNTCFYPEIFFDQEPPTELCIFDEAFPLDANSNIDGDFIYEIAGQTVTALDPSTLPPGTYDLEVTLIPLDTAECEAILIVSFDIANNCPAKLGDFVWEDLNFNGIQDPGEPGIPGVTVTVTSQDGTYTDTQQTDANGMYMFMVDPGTYKLTFEQPLGLVPSPQNQGGNDAIDSDVDPVMLMTDFVTVGPDEMNFTIDAGFYNECIANVTDPGTIGFDQELCGAGNVPDLLVELTPAQGGVGELNYLWMKNTVDPNQNIAFWTPIPNSNTPNLQLGPVYESTYYARCVRRNNCVFIESNTVFIEVGNDAEAIIQGVNVICEQTTTTYTAANANGASSIEWSFSGPANVTNNPDGSVDVFWGSFGIFSVTLSVTQNGCTATRTRTVTVLGNPASCGGDNFSANGTVNSLVARDVSINWMLPMDGSAVEFTVERSVDGNSFQQVGAVQEPIEMVNGNTGSYRFDEISPYAGVNYYRVWLHDSYGNSTVSNTVELYLSSGSSQLAEIYPNPAQGGNIHVQMLSSFSTSNQTTVQLYSSTGNLIASQPLSPGANTLDLAVTNQPSGVYFVRVINGESVETHQVIVE